MLSSLSQFSRKYFPAAIDQRLRDWAHRRGRTSYSQEGEDLILARHFGNRGGGFYIDVGAHHPFRFSNTYYFYRRGWRGLNIDAMPGSMAQFHRARPRDINIEAGVGVQHGTINFHVFDEPALNTFDEELARQRDAPPYRLMATVPVEVLPLADLLERHLPAGQVVDFLSVDVEGRDLDVLRSNDWQRFRPEVVVVETMSADLAALASDECAALLASVGYSPFAKAVHSSFFINRQRKT